MEQCNADLCLGNAGNRYFLHWLVVNIPAVDVNRGEVVTPYMGPVSLNFYSIIAQYSHP